LKDSQAKVIAFERGNLLFVFNFNPYFSHPHLHIGTSWPGKYEILLDTERKEYGGKGENGDAGKTFVASDVPHQGRRYSVEVSRHGD
jgi:1,4-alpha-glucan branching enzyme